MRNIDIPFKTVNGKSVIDMECLDILLEQYEPKKKNFNVPFVSIDGKSHVDMDYWDLLMDIDEQEEDFIEPVIEEVEFLMASWEPLKKEEAEVKIAPVYEPKEETKEVMVNAAREIGKLELQEEAIYNELMAVFEKPKKTPNMGNTFKQQVLAIWNDCVVKTSQPWKDKSNIIGETLNNDYCYYYDKIVSHSDEIEKLLLLVDYAATFDDLKKLNNGEEWTQFRQHVGFLMSLGNALGYIKFKNERQNWNMQEENNPEIAFSLVRK